MHRFVDPQICGSTDPCIHRSVDPQIRGSTDLWIHRSLDMRRRVLSSATACDGHGKVAMSPGRLGSTDLWIHESVDPQIRQPRPVVAATVPQPMTAPRPAWCRGRRWYRNRHPPCAVVVPSPLRAGRHLTSSRRTIDLSIVSIDRCRPDSATASRRWTLAEAFRTGDSHDRVGRMPGRRGDVATRPGRHEERATAPSSSSEGQERA